MSGATAGALDVELTRSRLTATAKELTHLLYRSAYSTLMRESRDCSFTLLSPAGEVVIDGPGTFHDSSYHYLAQSILARFPDMREGQVFVTNHPYEAGIPHTPDLGVVVPAFCAGRLVGLSCSIAHKSDFGGSVVGSASMYSTELYQEGLLLPPMLGWDGEQPNQTLLQIIAANVRNSDLFFGDMRAQVGVTRLGAQRLRLLAERTGVDTLMGVYAAILDHGERAVRTRVAGWPDGTASAEGFLDSDGVTVDRPVRLRVSVTVAGDRLSVDLRDCDDQTAGPVNMTPMYGDSAVFYAAVALTDPALGFNDGVRRAIDIQRREGSVLGPTPPAPVGAATSMQQRLIDLCVEAMGSFVPDAAIAHSGGSGGSGGTIGASWQLSRTGARALQYEVLGTAMGATHDSDGVSGCTVWATNLAMTPIEVLETQFPVRVTRFELLRDSGGAGRHRGGLSYRREYEALAPAIVQRRAERASFPGLGLDGGKPGSLARVTIARSGEAERSVPVSGRYELQPQDVLCVEGSGAGGMGRPDERDPDAVWTDVRRGYVSARSARDDYGVVLDQAGVDVSATAALRESRA